MQDPDDDGKPDKRSHYPSFAGHVVAPRTPVETERVLQCGFPPLTGQALGVYDCSKGSVPSSPPRVSAINQEWEVVGKRVMLKALPMGQSERLCLSFGSSVYKADKNLNFASVERCGHGTNFMFRFNEATRQLLHVSTRKCMDVAEAKWDEGQSVGFYECNGLLNQQFELKGAFIVVKQNGKCLSAC